MWSVPCGKQQVTTGQGCLLLQVMPLRGWEEGREGWNGVAVFTNAKSGVGPQLAGWELLAKFQRIMKLVLYTLSPMAASHDLRRQTSSECEFVIWPENLLLVDRK